MNLIIHVTDGVQGQPAEGAPISVSALPESGQPGNVTGRADDKGRFSCSGDAISRPAVTACRITIGIESYFATFGISSTQREVSLLVRTPDADRECHVNCLITPNTQFTYYQFLELPRPPLHPGGNLCSRREEMRARTGD